MPRSKREKDVSLTKVKKNRKEQKTKLSEEIRKCVDSYPNLFVFCVDNMRNSKLKDVRQHFKADSRFFFGKSKVMSLALGRIKEEEYQENLHRVSKKLSGQCGLLFTNRSIEEVRGYFNQFSLPDFARAGNDATQTVALSTGPLEQFPFSMEPQLRKLGMPVELQKGVVTLTKDYTVCKKGDKLSPEQAKILKLLDLETASFKLNVVCCWSRNGKFESFSKKKKDLMETD